VRVQALAKRYGRGASAVEALRGVSADLARGSFTAVMGPSGSGKSTLLNCTAGLEAPTQGHAWLGDVEITSLPEPARTIARRQRVGFVFQSFNLVAALTAGQNIVLPLRLAGQPPDRAWLDTLSTRVGLAERLHHRPAELSGGQQQRVAVVRALAPRPEVVFADEPTGNLDRHSGIQVLELLRGAVDELGQTVVLVTHDPIGAAFADRVLFLRDGLLVDALDRPTADAVVARMAALEA
jgi:putative ABC transport system ATP-binding protein